MDRFFLFCFRSCLKGENDFELYNALDINEDYKSATTDSIKKQYKKISLSLHPDKIAQRGGAVTDDDKENFRKAKEAYEILSDPKRRKTYDQLGMSGLKLMENPTEVDPLVILNNYKRNSTDRCTVLLLIVAIFAAITILPVLFSLKCDGSINDAPWVAIWTPMWIVDAVLLITAIGLFGEEHAKEEDAAGKKTSEGNDGANDGDEDDEHSGEKLPLTMKVYNLLSTSLFVLIQLFVLLRLDETIEWSWFAVFIPWFLYEAISIGAVLPSVMTRIPEPEKKRNSAEANLTDEEEGFGEEEAFMKQSEMEYFAKIVAQQGEQRGVVTSLLRIWLAIFLALKANGAVDWNWGLVFLPIWVHFALDEAYALFLHMWGSAKVAGIDEAAVLSGENQDPSSVIKVQQSRDLKNASFSTGCISPIFPLFMAIMLVCRIGTSATFSTFLIILPVFLVIGTCCCCVFCGLCCFACVDPSELEGELEKAKQGGGAGTGAGDEESGGAEGGGEGYVPPPAIVPEAPRSTDFNTTGGAEGSGAYGTFASAADVNTINVEMPEEGVEPVQQVHTKVESHIDEDID